MIDTMVVFTALFRVHLDRHGHALISFSDKMVVVKAVILAVDQNPEINAVTLGLIIVINDDISDLGIFGEVGFILPEGHNNLGRGIRQTRQTIQTQDL